MKKNPGILVYAVWGPVVLMVLIFANLVFVLTRPLCLLAGDEGTDWLSGSRKYPFSFIFAPYDTGFRIDYCSGDENYVITQIKDLEPDFVILSASHSSVPERFSLDGEVQAGEITVPGFALFFSPGYDKGLVEYFESDGRPVSRLPSGFPALPGDVEVIVPDYYGIKSAFEKVAEKKGFKSLIDTSSGGEIISRIKEGYETGTGSAVVSAVRLDFFPDGVVWYADVSFVGISIEYLKKKSQKNESGHFIFSAVMPKIIKKSL